jgi:type IV pilus assembly protein PilW
MVTTTEIIVQKSLSNEKGLTLVEILIALALGAFLTTAIIQIVSNNKQNIVLADSSVQVQESARLALELLARDIRMAGYRGCLNDASGSSYTSSLGSTSPFFHNYINGRIDLINNFDPKQKASYVSSGKMPFSEGFGPSPAVAGVAKLPVNNSDVFIMRSAVPSNIYVDTNATTASAPLSVKGSDISAVENGRIMIVSDCQTADIFVAGPMTKGISPITRDSGQAGYGGVTNSSGVFSGLFTSGSQISFMNTSAYFIAPSSIIVEDYDTSDSIPNDINSLYKFSQLNGLQELIPYVSDFQLEYGVDTGTGISVDGQIDAYVNGSNAIFNAAGSTDRIISVRIILSVASRNSNVDKRISTDPNYDPYSRVKRDYIKVIELRNAKTGF